jgi:putative transcription factor
MLECELCGKVIKGKAYVIKIDSTEVIACEECAAGKEIIRVIGESKETKAKAKKVEEEKEEIAFDYGERIKKAREELKIPLKVLAERINEKESYLKRVEDQEVLPSEEVARKLEKELGIKLFEKVEEKNLKTQPPKNLSLEDIATKKEKKRTNGR